MTTYSYGEILSQLDAADADGEFLNLDNGFYVPLCGRINLYRDESRWAIVIDAVGFNVVDAAVIDVLHYYGNCLTRGSSGFENDDFLIRVNDLFDLMKRRKMGGFEIRYCPSEEPSAN